MQLNGTAAIVTGGASGLGAATAELFAAGGAKVAIFDLNEDKGEAHAAKIGARFLRVDTTSEADVIAGLDKAENANGLARILVACAGGGVGGGRTAHKGKAYAMEGFRKTLEMNVIGTFNTLSKFAARLTDAPLVNGEERGVIVCTASIAAYDGQIGQVAYATAKAGIVGMTLVVARDLGDAGIRCNTIAPGPFGTPPMLGVRPEMLQSLLAQQPFPKRLGQPSEFALLAKSIVENPMLNGTVIRIDGATRFGPK